MSENIRDQPRVSTFGNWRRPAGPGLMGLGLFGTVALLLAFIVGIGLILVSLVAALVWAVFAVTLLIPISMRRDGRSGWSRLTARLAWGLGQQAGQHLYRSGIAGVVPHGHHQLPGIAARTELLEFRDAADRPMGLIHLPVTGHFAVVLRCEADGAALVDQDQVETWVASWGLWLATLGHEPGLVGVTVTVETAPDPGTRLQAELDTTTRPDAPDLARRVLAEIAASYPAGSSAIATRIQLIYRPAGPAVARTPEAVAVDLSNRVPVLTSTLAGTGAGAAAPMSAAEITEVVRVAYDPAAAALIEALHGIGGPTSQAISWQDAGPAAARESWGSYQHDSGISTSWIMSEAPRGTVLSAVLSSLLGPHPDIPRKRVTLVYRPHDPATAAQLVEADVRNAVFLATSKRAGSARSDLALRSARQTAAEEAAGSGLVRFSLLVTITVTDPAQQLRVERIVESQAAAARLQLRRAGGAQAITFAAGLPTGIVLTEHTYVPTLVRDGLT